MNETTKRDLSLLAALGSLLTLIAVDLGKLTVWGDVLQPGFVAQLALHLGVVLGGYAAGKYNERI